MRQIGNAQLHGSVPEERFDDVLAFFLFCYSLRDWLIRTGDITGADVDALIQSSVPMRICRDICNRSKHFSINRKPFDADFSIGREYADPLLGGPGESETWFIIAGSEKYDLFAIADACMEFWRQLIASGRLKEPPDPFGHRSDSS